MVLWQHPKMFVYDLSLFTLQTTSVWAKHKLLLYLYFPTTKVIFAQIFIKVASFLFIYGILSSESFSDYYYWISWKPEHLSSEENANKRRKSLEKCLIMMSKYWRKWPGTRHRLRKHLNCTPSLAARIFPLNPFLSISCQQIIRMFLRVTNAFLMVIYICSVKSTLTIDITFSRMDED